jgi:hypothetical protein
MQTPANYKQKRRELETAIYNAVVGCGRAEAAQDAERTAERIFLANPDSYTEHMNIEINKYRSM